MGAIITRRVIEFTEHSVSSGQCDPVIKTGELQGAISSCVRLFHLTQSRQYTQPGSNWRPSACEADVIATRPWVLESTCQMRNIWPLLANRDGRRTRSEQLRHLLVGSAQTTTRSQTEEHPIPRLTTEVRAHKTPEREN